MTVDKSTEKQTDTSEIIKQMIEINPVLLSLITLFSLTEDE